MAIQILTMGDDFYISNLVPTGSETANAIYGLAGNDTIIGNQYDDFIYGGSGNDVLIGGGGDDFLLGDTGNDTLAGGTGQDTLNGQDGDDVLYGNTGVDALYGGQGNDHYHVSKSDNSIDTINDDKSPTGGTGYGGGSQDAMFFDDVNALDIRFYQSGNDLWVTDVTDIQDGYFNTGSII